MCEFERSYELQGLGDEVVFHRNRKFLKPVNDKETASEAVDKPELTRPRPSESAEKQFEQLRRSTRLLEKQRTGEYFNYCYLTPIREAASRK